MGVQGHPLVQPPSQKSQRLLPCPGHLGYFLLSCLLESFLTLEKQSDYPFLASLFAMWSLLTSLPQPPTCFLRACSRLGFCCVWRGGGGEGGSRRFLGPKEPRPDFQARVFLDAQSAGERLRASARSLARSRGHSRVLSGAARHRALLGPARAP